ncbi:MAG TPA: fenitrothion hydrolase [Solirubrobacteraceae bacterium]
MFSTRRLLPAALGGLGIVALLFPAVASAHGIVGRADLPIPVWLFSWTAAIVLVVSFVALSTLWMRPQLQSEHRKRLFAMPAVLACLASLIGLALFALVLYSGFDGAQVWSVNFAPTFIYVIFWVGFPVASVLFGDIFRAFSPWRSFARAIRWSGRKIAPRAFAQSPLRYPGRLGMWPAVAVIVGFAWMELVYIFPDRDQPSTLAALSLAYFVVMLAGMALFGVDEWTERADGFGAYFGLLSRMSVLCEDEHGVVYSRRPLSGLPDMPIRAGTIGLICAVIGTTTFDGFSNGGIWRANEPSLQSLFADLGFNQTPALELAYSLGLVLCVLLIAGIYRLGIVGVHSVSHRFDTNELRHTFAHTLVPIGFAYVLAHYFSLLIWQGQAIGYLASDPLGNGANLLGTSAYRIDYTIISYAAIWYVQVAALIAGHVGGLALAHDRALSIYPNQEQAIRSQYWMLAVMVAFTSFGLWLLSAVGT